MLVCRTNAIDNCQDNIIDFYFCHKNESDMCVVYIFAIHASRGSLASYMCDHAFCKCCAEMLVCRTNANNLTDNRGGNMSCQITTVLYSWDLLVLLGVGCLMQKWAKVCWSGRYFRWWYWSP